MENLDFKQFLEGKEPFPLAGFYFSDDMWDFSSIPLTSAIKPSGKKINFKNIKPFLKNPVKAYISWGLLAMDYSLAWCIKQMISFNWFSKYLSEYREEINQFNLLDRGVEEGFSIYIKEKLSDNQIETVSKHISSFIKWVKKEYKLDFDFKPRKIANTNKQNKIVDQIERLVPFSVVEQLVCAIGRNHKELWSKWCNRPASKKPKGAEILYLQILKISILSPLRISQILLLDRMPYRLSEPDEAPGIWIRFTESKTHQGLQETFIPTEEYAEIIKEAIEVAQKFTEDLSMQTNLNYLFLTKNKGGSNGGGFIRNVSAESFRLWLNGRLDENGNIARKGFIHRNEIKYKGDYYQIEPHQMRHTIVTIAYEEGADYGTIMNYLKHRTFQWTGAYTHTIKKQYDEISDMYEKREKNVDTNSKIANKEVRVEPFCNTELKYYKGINMYLQPSLYGVCLTNQNEKPCIIGSPTWLGPIEDPIKTQDVFKYYNLDIKYGYDIELLQEQLYIWKEDNTKDDYIKNIEELIERYKSNSGTDFEENNDEKEKNEFEKREGFYDNFIEKFQEKKKENKQRTKNVSLPANKKEFDFNGKHTSQVIEDNFNNLMNMGVKFTLTELAELCELSVVTIHRKRPDIIEKVRELTATSKPTLDEKTLTTQVQGILNEMVQASEEITICEVARRCGVDRTTFYQTFPQILTLIQDFIEEHKKEKEEEVLNQVEKEIQNALYSSEKITIIKIEQKLGKRRNFLYENHPEAYKMVKNAIEKQEKEEFEKTAKAIEHKVKKELENIKDNKEDVSSIKEVCNRCDINYQYMIKYLPELKNYIVEFLSYYRKQFFNNIKNRTVDRALEEDVKEALEKLKDLNIRITVTEIARMCKTDRRGLYDKANIIEMINEYKEEQKAEIESVEEKVERIMNEIIANREEVKSVNQIIKKSCLDRRLIYYDYPHLHERIKEFVKNNKNSS